jgi:hypothetical protein
MALQPFTLVEDGIAILRLKNGVHKQVKVYHRGGKLFVPMSGGFVRIVPQRWDDYFATGHPDAKVLEIEGEGITIDGKVLAFVP